MHLRPVTGPRPERPRHGHCFLINPSGSLSLSLSQSRCVCRVFIFKDTAHIGPSNACPRAAPETTPLWRLFLIKLSLSLSLSLRGVTVTVVRLRTFGLWRVCFPPCLWSLEGVLPPCLVRPGRRLPVQGLSEGSLGYRDRLPA